MKEFNICFGNELSCLYFCEIFEAVYSSLVELGYPCSVSTGALEKERINIVFDYHRMQYCESMSDCVYIPYQFEQLSEDCGLFNANVLSILRNANCVFEYSIENLQFLQTQGVSGIHLPVGFHPSLKRIESDENKTIDVLFYGALNERRQRVLDALSKRGLHVVVLTAVFGPERDDYISKSKIVLNVHYYPMGIMEVARLSYLLNNEVFILSESSIVNPLKSVGLFSVDYALLADCCMKFVEDNVLRKELSTKNALLFKRQFDMKRALGGALHALRSKNILF